MTPVDVMVGKYELRIASIMIGGEQVPVQVTLKTGDTISLNGETIIRCVE